MKKGTICSPFDKSSPLLGIIASYRNYPSPPVRHVQTKTVRPTYGLAALRGCAAIANFPNSFFTWEDAGNDLAPVPSVSAKVFVVGGPDHAGVRQLAHANQARVGQLHSTIGIFIEQLQNSGKMRPENEVQDEVASGQQLDSNAGVSCQKAQFVQDGLAGDKRGIRRKFALAPCMIQVLPVQGRQQQAGIGDMFHDEPVSRCRTMRRIFALVPGPVPRESEPSRSAEANLCRRPERPSFSRASSIKPRTKPERSRPLAAARRSSCANFAGEIRKVNTLDIHYCITTWIGVRQVLVSCVAPEMRGRVGRSEWVERHSQ